MLQEQQQVPLQNSDAAQMLALEAIPRLKDLNILDLNILQTLLITLQEQQQVPSQDSDAAQGACTWDHS